MKNYSNYDPRKVVITVDKNVTLARIFDDNNEVVSKGVAKCSPEDTFDFELGSKLALTRALEAMKSKQEWVVVNRKPCAGDYVRIVDPCFTFNEKGDILRVTRADGWRVFVKASDHPRYESNVSVSSHGKDFQWCYLFGYVEVVEPANPEPPKNSDINWVVVERGAKAGDFIRLKHEGFSFNKVGDILRVAKSCEGGSLVKVRAEDHPREEWVCLRHGGEYLWNYRDNEFEVVEPAPKKPEFRKITRLPKSGDYVKFIKSSYGFDTPDRMLKISKVIVIDRRVIAVEVRHGDHPGAVKWHANKRNKPSEDAVWHYNHNFNKWEFYEKVDDTVEVWNGKRFRKVDREVRAGDYIKLAKPFFSFDNTTDFLKVYRVSDHYGRTISHVLERYNPGAIACNFEHDDDFVWNYWDFTGNVYECLDD